MKFLSIVIWGLLSSSMAAHAQAVPPQLKGAVRQVIEHGNATMWASPAMAEAVNRSIGRGPEARLRIVMTRLQTFGPDCARVNMQFVEETSKPLFAMQMNLCKDGSPPFDSVDLSDPVAPPQATVVPRLKQLHQK